MDDGFLWLATGSLWQLVDLFTADQMPSNLDEWKYFGYLNAIVD